MQSLQKILMSSGCESARFKHKKSTYSEMFDVLQSLRQHEKFCDIKLETDDGTIIFGHKAVLASASPYFYAMFTKFAEKNKGLVCIKQMDSTILQLLIDFIYSGKIIVTIKNVQALLPAANLLQLHDVSEACCDFLQKQLHSTNCLGINAFAEFHSCTQLLTCSALFIRQNFSKVIEGDEFLSLSSEQVVMLISSDELTVPSEEKVFECVIRWVKHELDSRKCILPQLMEHVRLPLTSENYMFQKVVKEPLLDNPKCKHYIMEALHFHFLKRTQSDQLITVPECIRIKPRRPAGLRNVIFVVGGIGAKAIGSTEWYDPKINQWQTVPEIMPHHDEGGLALLKDNFVFAVGGVNGRSSLQSVDVLDLSSESPCWKSCVDMLVKRRGLGVGILNNYLYAVGGHDGSSGLNSAEVFDYSTQEWRMVSNMSFRRAGVSVGVLKNLLFAIGGYDDLSEEDLNSVECYHPSLDTWTPVAEMCVPRSNAGVGVLDGVLYAVGGHDGFATLKSVEAFTPNTGVWITIADMHLHRQNAGVAALDGLLYVFGGISGSTSYDSVEFYNPISNAWTLLEASINVGTTILCRSSSHGQAS